MQWVRGIMSREVKRRGDRSKVEEGKEEREAGWKEGKSKKKQPSVGE